MAKSILLHVFMLCPLMGADVKPEVIAKLKNSTFLIESECLGKPIGSGTGFTIGDGKTLVTAFHVVYYATDLKITNLGNGKKYTFERVGGVDLICDTIKLQIKETAPDYLECYTGKATQGKAILIYGNPVGLNGTLSTGMISSIDLDRGGLIQFDGNISPGNSGGPITDFDGKALGIVSSKLVGSAIAGLNFASPMKRIMQANNGCKQLEIASILSLPDYLDDLRPGVIPKKVTTVIAVVNNNNITLTTTYNHYGNIKESVSIFDKSIPSYDDYGFVIRNNLIENPSSREDGKYKDIHNTLSDPLYRGPGISSMGYGIPQKLSLYCGTFYSQNQFSPLSCDIFGNGLCLVSLSARTVDLEGLSMNKKNLETIIEKNHFPNYNINTRYYQYVVDENGNWTNKIESPEYVEGMQIVINKESIENRKIALTRIIDY